MWSSPGIVTVFLAILGHSWGRFLPSGANMHRFRAPHPFPIQSALRWNSVDRNQYPDIPEYVFKSVLDYPPETQDKLLLEHQDAEVTPGFYQGDMVGLSPQEFLANTRVGLKWDIFPEKRWDNATVPYVISPLYLPNERNVIDTAIATLNFMTCIKFVPWDNRANDYLLIWPIKQPAGCWSFVGKRGGQQIVSLQQPDKRSRRCFASVGKPIHELLHALGIFHEQGRSDRDEHVTIVKDNIIEEFLHNFNKKSAVNTTFSFDYDYNSVMHYGSHFFSYSRSKPTIIPKVEGVTIGQRLMLSKTDCLKVNHLYGCLDENDQYQRKKYMAICRALGL